MLNCTALIASLCLVNSCAAESGSALSALRQFYDKIHNTIIIYHRETILYYDDEEKGRSKGTHIVASTPQVLLSEIIIDHVIYDHDELPVKPDWRGQQHKWEKNKNYTQVQHYNVIHRQKKFRTTAISPPNPQLGLQASVSSILGWLNYLYGYPQIHDSRIDNLFDLKQATHDRDTAQVMTKYGQLTISANRFGFDQLSMKQYSNDDFVYPGGMKVGEVEETYCEPGDRLQFIEHHLKMGYSKDGQWSSFVLKETYRSNRRTTTLEHRFKVAKMIPNPTQEQIDHYFVKIPEESTVHVINEPQVTPLVYRGGQVVRHVDGTVIDAEILLQDQRGFWRWWFLAPIIAALLLVTYLLNRQLRK